jgi:exodeoxyribonuclease VII small subunit
MAEPGVDQMLDELEKVVARLAEAREPIEELVVAYEDGTRILAEAEARLANLSEAAVTTG